MKRVRHLKELVYDLAMFNGRSGPPSAIGKAKFWIETKNVIDRSVHIGRRYRTIDRIGGVLIGCSDHPTRLDTTTGK